MKRDCFEVEVTVNVGLRHCRDVKCEFGESWARAYSVEVSKTCGQTEEEDVNDGFPVADGDLHRAVHVAICRALERYRNQLVAFDVIDLIEHSSFDFDELLEKGEDR